MRALTRGIGELARRLVENAEFFAATSRAVCYNDFALNTSVVAVRLFWFSC